MQFAALAAEISRISPKSFCRCLFPRFSLVDEKQTVPMLIDVVKKHDPSIQAVCLGVMQNLSSNTAFHRRLLERGVLEALDSSKDVDAGALGVQCAAVLYNFSLHEESITQMMELGGIFLVTHLSYSHTIKVRSTWCATLGPRCC